MFISNKGFYLSVIIIALFYFSVNARSVENAGLNSKPPDIQLTKTYKTSTGDYSINYHNDWIVENTGKNSVLFSGKRDSLSYYSTVTIQTIGSKKSAGKYESVKDVINDVRKQVLAESPKTTFLNSGPFIYTMQNGRKLEGEFLIFIYSFKSHIIEQWQIVLPSKEGLVFYTWAYTSPLSQYGKDLEIAKSMLASWTIY
jgi:hypothetical protein